MRMRFGLAESSADCPARVDVALLKNSEAAATMMRQIGRLCLVLLGCIIV